MAWSHIEGLEERVGTSMSSIGHLVAVVYYLSSITRARLRSSSWAGSVIGYLSAWVELHKLWA